MIESLKLRKTAFVLHRYIGLAVGLLFVVVGLTGSLLVFEPEIDHLAIVLQFGAIVPQSQQVSLESVLAKVTQAYASHPDLKITAIDTVVAPKFPYKVEMRSPTNENTEVFVNPYTGSILGSRLREKTFSDFILKLHYELLVGKVGETIVGIAALLLLLLSATGTVLWPGWRKLIQGFKIKWQAHPQRTNFDIHKVVGIIAAAFLIVNAFTGFCWNFLDLTKPLVHTLTLTPTLPNPRSQPTLNKSPLELAKILQIADAILPGAVTTHISLPQQPEEIFRIRKKFSQEAWMYGYSFVYLDQYTGEVLQLKNGLKPSLADKFFNSFAPIHFGTFGGLLTRIFYVFVGLTPTILFVTGWVIYRARQ